jgi:hypothetical protein
MIMIVGEGDLAQGRHPMDGLQALTAQMHKIAQAAECVIFLYDDGSGYVLKARMHHQNGQDLDAHAWMQLVEGYAESFDVGGGVEVGVSGSMASYYKP